MFRLFTKNTNFLKPTLTSKISQGLRIIKPVPVFRTATIASLPLFMYLNHHVYCVPPKKDEEPGSILKISEASPELVENPQTPWEKIKSVLSHIFRMFQLMFIFLPPILALPLRLFKRTENVWLDMFVWSVERAGVVWIKAFQYLSHRRDVIGPEMAESFNHLRENAPQHSFAETKRNFKRSYGKEIHEIFDHFEEIPIASGSVSQVYKAVYKGKKVAVKVRHP